MTKPCKFCRILCLHNVVLCQIHNKAWADAAAAEVHTAVVDVPIAVDVVSAATVVVVAGAQNFIFA